MTAAEQVKIIQRRERALFDIKKTLFDVGTNKRGGSIRVVDSFYGRYKKIDESEYMDNIESLLT